MAAKNDRAAKAEAKKKAQAQAIIVAAHRHEIDAFRASGTKPSDIATWLRQFGFDGSGATLNGILPWRPDENAPKPERKKAGRPRIHKDSAARLKAFRAGVGHRYDIHVGHEAAMVMRALQEQSGLSASGVIDAVLRGALKVARPTKSLPAM